MVCVCVCVRACARVLLCNIAQPHVLLQGQEMIRAGSVGSEGPDPPAPGERTPLLRGAPPGGPGSEGPGPGERNPRLWGVPPGLSESQEGLIPVNTDELRQKSITKSEHPPSGSKT